VSAVLTPIWLATVENPLRKVEDFLNALLYTEFRGSPRCLRIIWTGQTLSAHGLSRIASWLPAPRSAKTDLQAVDGRELRLDAVETNSHGVTPRVCGHARLVTASR
jgi:hypothetical protein